MDAKINCVWAGFILLILSQIATTNPAFFSSSIMETNENKLEVVTMTVRLIIVRQW